MFGLNYWVEAVLAEREVYKNACKQPLYRHFVSKIEDDIVRCCMDRCYEEISFGYTVHPSMDARIAERMVRSAFKNGKNSCGLKIIVVLDDKRRILTCRVPKHSPKY